MPASASVTQVIGAVVDCAFPQGVPLPSIYTALTVDIEDHPLTLEVQQHLDGGIVRTVAMG